MNYESKHFLEYSSSEREKILQDKSQIYNILNNKTIK